MKFIAVIACVFALFAFAQPAEATSYTGNSKIRAELINPICVNGKTVHRVRLVNRTNRTVEFKTASATFDSKTGLLVRSASSTTAMEGPQRTVQRVARLDSDQHAKVTVTFRNEVLINRKLQPAYCN